jgi:hypothetical protein
LAACERMEHHLTAAIVSNDVAFQRHVLANTVNGTTYVGARARTTGAPQNHFFGPAGITHSSALRWAALSIASILALPALLFVHSARRNRYMRHW